MLLPSLVRAQMFTPAASALPDGSLNQTYVGQVIDFTVPQNATISGEVVEQALAIVYPQTQPVLGLLNISNQNFDLLVDRTTIIVNGLPNGLTADCDATPCTYISGASGYVTIAGTPSESGQFTVDLITLTEGDVDISSITGGVLSSFGLPSSLGLPTPVPSSLSEEGYTLNVANTSGISEWNNSYGVSVYPNPASDLVNLRLDTKVIGMATIELYSITGRSILSISRQTKQGVNQFPINIGSVAKGLYFAKVILNETPTLVRIEKL